MLTNDLRYFVARRCYDRQQAQRIVSPFNTVMERSMGNQIAGIT